MSIPRLSAAEIVSDAKIIVQRIGSPFPLVNPSNVHLASAQEEVSLTDCPLTTPKYFVPPI